MTVYRVQRHLRHEAARGSGIQDSDRPDDCYPAGCSAQ
ncbi:hypothetical protein SBADM41S_07875 [Streptomyces badius]